MVRGFVGRTFVIFSLLVVMMVAFMGWRLAWGEEQTPRVIEITATAGSHFVPDEITVSPGETVIFRITAERNSKGLSFSRILHGFQILEGNTVLIQKNLKTGGKKGTDEWNRGVTEVAWTAPQKKGQYLLMCHKPCGPEHDRMTGKIIVR